MYEVDGQWELEVVDIGGGTYALPAPFPDAHTHRRERFPDLEAAVSAAGVPLMPTSILSCIKLDEDAVRSVRLLPGAGGFYVIRLDATANGDHHHERAPAGPYPLAEAMRVGLDALLSDRDVPICPCIGTATLAP